MDLKDHHYQNNPLNENTFYELYPPTNAIIICIKEGLAIDGIYIASAYYCPNPDCDCGHGTLGVCKYNSDQKEFTYDPDQEVLINLGWEEASFYKDIGFDLEEIQMMKVGYLDTFAKQPAHAQEFLMCFRAMVKENPMIIDYMKVNYPAEKRKVKEKIKIKKKRPKRQKANRNKPKKRK